MTEFENKNNLSKYFIDKKLFFDFRTFDALNVTCFSAGELMFNKTDKFLDLQKVVRKLKFSHVLDDNDDDDFSDDDFSEDTLDYFLDISSRYFYFLSKNFSRRRKCYVR